MYPSKVLIFSSLITPLFAQVTTSPTDPCTALDYPFSVLIEDQSDLDRIVDCTTLNANLTIVTNTTSSLPNLVTILGGVLIYAPVSLDGKVLDRQVVGNDSSPMVLSFPRLEEIRGNLDIRSPDLRTLELPSLSTVSSIELYTPALETWTMASSLHCSALRVFEHNIRKLELHNLVNISSIWAYFDNEGSVSLKGTIKNDPDGSLVAIGGKNFISFTSDLQNSDNTTISLENCQNITVNELRLGTLSITNNPELVYLSAPFLTRLIGTTQFASLVIEKNGNLKGCAFPNLVEIDDNLIVNSNERLASFGEGFPSLERVGGWFDVIGNLTSFQLPKKVVVGKSATIRSSVDSFDCDAIEDNFANDTSVSCSPDHSTVTVVPTVSASEENHKKGLSYPAKIGLGVGIAVFIVLSIGLGCGFCLWRSHRHPDRSGRAATISSNLLRIWAKESFQKKPPSYPLQDFSSRRGDEPLPSYQARPSSTATTLAPDVHDVSRPGTGTQPSHHLDRNLGRSVASSRPVSPVSPVSVSPPSPAHLSTQPDRSTLPPDYRP